MKLHKLLTLTTLLISLPTLAADPPQHWPSFRGPGHTGIANGYPTPTTWNANPEKAPLSNNILFRVKVPGLAHSSPIVYGDKLFLITAVSEDGDAPLMLGRGGQPTAAEDHGIQNWYAYCFNKNTGEELWRKLLHAGKPGATRHAKATHANSSLTTDGKHLLAFLGSEGLHLLDLDGNRIWSKSLGTVNISKYGIGWGYASSPALHGDRIALLCDDPENPFLAVHNLADGQELYRVNRSGISERSWATPYILETDNRTQIVANGWPYVVSYDLDTGQELWRIKGGGDNPIPTPFVYNKHIYISSAHGRDSPIYVVDPAANGDITPPKPTADNPAPASKHMPWSINKGGSYMSTPVVVNDHIFLATGSIVRCFHATTGAKVYEARLETGAAIIASLVAADDKIYAASENGKVYVLAAAPEFKVLATNEMAEPLFATPAISQGVLYFRTTGSLIAVK
ncbi:MAG: PQQ-binding-like beta-propeller repeat protein [Planctomycetota bacterium]|jgi:outer membrane protein assembly factor BamB